MDLIASAAARAEPLKKVDNTAESAGQKVQRVVTGTLGNKPLNIQPKYELILELLLFVSFICFRMDWRYTLAVRPPILSLYYVRM